MGQKVNPHGLESVLSRMDSRWYAEADFCRLPGLKIIISEHFLKKKLYSACVSKIEIERASEQS